VSISRPEQLPAGAASLRAPLPDPYVYRSALKRGAAHTLDALGAAFFAPHLRLVNWSKVRRIAVLRLDHLGDLLHALPALRRLRRALPQARIDLYVGPWGFELAELFADVDRLFKVEADWFKRPERVEWPWGQINALGRRLEAERYDAAFELRGDLRHHLALRRAGIPVRVGQALTAGAFLLTHPVRWNADLHEQEQSLSLLDQAGVPAAAQGSAPYLEIHPEYQRQATALLKELKLGAKPLMIQAACGTPAKRWPLEHWAWLLKRRPKGSKAVLLGSAAEAEEMHGIAKAAGAGVAVAAGRLDLPGLAAFLKRARLLLSVDSGPAHLAAVQGVPVLALYSATNRASQWAPKGKRVRVLQAQGFPCSPCERTECPFDNACMRALGPALALRALRSMWQARA
jgi:ADP-heptose:LPS heptosyltransferase